MLKKNKLPIFLLALVIMLSIFYITDSKVTGDDPGANPVNGETKYAAYATMRLELLEERTSAIEEYETQIASGELSNVEIENLMILVDAIYEQSYTEVALENELIALGYDDVLVYVLDGKVNIDILTDSFTASEFVSIALLSKEKFDSNYTVSIHTTATTA